MHTITVDINGRKAEVAVAGFKGKGCQQLTVDLFGQTDGESRLTGEFNQVPTEPLERAQQQVARLKAE